MSFASDFFVSKTNWVSLLAVLTAAAGYIEGHLDGKITVGGIFLAVLIAFVRDTMQKNTDAIHGLPSDGDPHESEDKP